MALSNIIRFILTGDNASAVRAMRETATVADETSDSVEAGNERQAASYDLAAESSKRLRDSVVTLAGIAGLAGLAFGIKDVVEAGTKWRADQAQLISALKDTGTYSAKTLNQINAATAASSTKGGFSDVTQSGGVTKFLTMLGSVNAAMKANTAVTDVARRLNIGYAQAQMIVARASTGVVTRIQQYIGAIVPVTKYTDNMTAAQKRLYPQMYRNAQLENQRATWGLAYTRIMKTMGSATAAYGKTTEGAITNSENAFQLLEQFLGSKFRPIIKAVANWLKGVALAILNNWPAITRVIRQVFSPLTTVIKWLGGVKTAAATIGVLLGEWVTYIAVMKGIAIATKLWAAAMLAADVYTAYASVGVGGLTGAWAALNAVMDVNPIMLALTALAVGIALVVTHFKTFKSIVSSVFNWFKGAVTTVVNWLSSHWASIESDLTAPFTTASRWIVNKFNSIVTFVASLPGKIAKIGVHMWDGLKSGLISVLDWCIKKINSLINGYNSVFGWLTGNIGTIKLISNASASTSASRLGGGSTVPSSAMSAPYMPQRSSASATPVPAVGAGIGNGTVLPIHVHVNLDNRQIAEGVTHYTLKKQAAS